MWSFPGGKIQLGESTLAAAQRELREETQLSPQDWHNRPFCVSDSIHWNDETGEVQYHYVIAQCFCTLPSSQQQPLMPSDDAVDAKWFHLEEMHLLHKQLTPGVIQVIETCENMYEKGLLSTK
jgi:8-oxo-dGTP pyrophosphatase MutT (NUDIX family)